MADDGVEYEWVEILEPESRQKMYANVLTGECRWAPPEGVKYKETNSDQWWELKDSRTNRSYYFNATTHETKWQKPEKGDIIALSRLQKMQEELAKEEQKQEEDEEEELPPPPSPQPEPRQQHFQQPPQHQPPSHPSPPLRKESEVEQESRAAAAAAPSEQHHHHHHSHSHAHSPPAAPAAASAAPPAPKLPPPVAPKPDFKAASANGDLTKFKENLATHKKGLLFKKVVSLHNMLSWSKEMIPRAMLLTLKGNDQKAALDLFKLLQMYMSDRNSKGRDPGQIAHEIVQKCWSTSTLRDEIFLQLCKQTTGNTSDTSLERGWELLIICLCFFPPSAKFFSYLQGYIARNADGTNGDVVQKLATYAYKKLDRIFKTGAKKGQKDPTLDEVEHARQAITNPSVFGSTLEEIMEMQHSQFPDLPIPWVLTVLTRAVLKNQGAETEGIFRVPGDIDAVNSLKVSLNKGQAPQGIADPHVPGSALKLWFRELEDPVIPEDLYDECIAGSSSADASVQVINKLPHTNKQIILYILRFLQIIGQPENQKKTKMNYDNLAMVWAPNFLRCPSNDPMVIFNNTKREMTFVRHLILNVNTDEVAHIA